MFQEEEGWHNSQQDIWFVCCVVRTTRQEREKERKRGRKRGREGERDGEEEEKNQQKSPQCDGLVQFGKEVKNGTVTIRFNLLV